MLFCAAVSASRWGSLCVLAVFADQRDHAAARIYRTLLIWPYAVAPAIAAVLWLLLLNPQIGLLGALAERASASPGTIKLNGGQAMLMVILASAWKQMSYNFIFFLAGLQSIPRAVIEAARMDGARGWRRFRTITFPLLMPTIFFLLVVNLVYAAFDTFGTIQALTQGGPGKATETLVVKVYRDGVVNLDLGSSSAQSVVLMVGVIAADRGAVPLPRAADQRMSDAVRTDWVAHAVLLLWACAVRAAGLAGRSPDRRRSPAAIARGDLSLLPRLSRPWRLSRRCCEHGACGHAGRSGTCC